MYPLLLARVAVCINTYCMHMIYCIVLIVKSPQADISWTKGAKHLMANLDRLVCVRTYYKYMHTYVRMYIHVQLSDTMYI